ncbi:NADH:flavin oxidoreductase/NADH oxidase [Kutzneria sp. CA-103260]|uniref:NADH:flavin oxidoreductase/NADH oxidase n=1 Tax=Kutzneria sp. CA-103260 TaxID=2802641 RepID=UPI001BAE4033|nr:NADH:flavin oxidoreductase/NADH oxidase [Kutzneria sp. CA-103260]QUQ65118.1 NADH:flavin oxidoreductase/NADH oxidase [Kutzneria sp. CA-103260]
MSKLLSPVTVRGVTARNRIWVSPMCQYSANADGLPTDWHFMHLGQFAAGGAGLVMTEATAVSPEGRITQHDVGIWNDEQVAAWRRITDFAHAQGTKIAMQLGHAGRKASARRPWEPHGTVTVDEGGWQSVAPSAVAFGDYAAPKALTEDEIHAVVADFAAAAKRAIAAGFDAVELHGGHGYLIHQFYSPLSNQRTDGYGGDFDGRVRFALEVATAVRAAIGDDVPLFTRLSATDWADDGWTADDTVRLARLLADVGVDLIDTSTAGNTPKPQIPIGPGYQVPFAQRVRTEAKVLTGAVGLITEPQQAEQIVATGAADVVFLARAVLRDPHWPLNAARVLGADIEWPNQYVRARLS